MRRSRQMLLLVAVLAAYRVGWTGYAWETWSVRHPSERGGRLQYLFAGGCGLVAVGVPLLVLALGTDLFVLALVDYRAGLTPGVVALGLLPLGPLLVIACGVRAVRGDAPAAVAGALLALSAYAWLLARGDAGWLVAAAPGLLAPFVLLAGVIRPDRVRVEAQHR